MCALLSSNILPAQSSERLCPTRLHQVFSEIDVDGDESMSLDEFIVNRHLLGLKTLNLEEATELFHQIDDDHSGNVRE